MRKLILLIVVLPLFSYAQSTSSGNLADTLAKLQAWRKTTDFKASGRLAKIAASGDRQNNHIALRARYFPEGLKVFCEITEPAPAEIRILLEPKAGGGTKILSGRAGDASPKDLSATGLADPLAGTDFALEDLMDAQYFWKNQTWRGEAACGARHCYVIKSQPSPSDRSGYSTVTSWIDQESYFPIMVEKVVKGSGAVKEFTNYGLRQVKGRWSASQIGVEVKGKPGSSLLIITGGAENANLPASQFDPKLLIQQKQ